MNAVHSIDLESAMRLAVQEARKYLGRTAPNPPVGAVVLAVDGTVLGVGAHVQAGTDHAEVMALKNARESHPHIPAHTVVVTLEPCNHQGRTPPCTQAILAAGVKKVVVGQRDPNCRVAGAGIQKLKDSGVEVVEGVLSAECGELIESFTWFCQTGKPWVTLKTAHQADGSMIPPVGQKTFTSEASLVFAHELRKRSQVLITGSGTVLADAPWFTVRHVQDHPGMRRTLVVLDRRGRVPRDWVKKAESQGFEVWIPVVETSLESLLQELGSRGCVDALVEAGPTLSQAFLSENLVNRHYKIQVGKNGQADQIERIDMDLKAR